MTTKPHQAALLLPEGGKFTPTSGFQCKQASLFEESDKSTKAKKSCRLVSGRERLFHYRSS